MISLLTLAWALPVIEPAVKTGARQDRDAALVIGVEDYFMLPDVPHADADADAFRDFLIYTRGLPEGRVRRLGRGASREQIEAAVQELGSSVGRDGTMWVYFAGHGATDPTTGERVVLGADTQADAASFQARAVRVATLRDGALRGGGRAVLVFEASFSGLGQGGASLGGGVSAATPSATSHARALEWTAAGAGEWTSPVSGAPHGAFTWAALGALRGWADGQRDGVRDGAVTAEEAQLYVGEALRKVGLTDQHPTLSGDARSWTLSTGNEPAPDLAREPAAAAAPTSDDDDDDDDLANLGQIVVQTSGGIVLVYVDGRALMPECLGCSKVEGYGIEPGPHRVEVRNAFGGTLAAAEVQINAGERLRLSYSRKVLQEVERDAAVTPPPPPPPPPPAATAPPANTSGGFAEALAAMKAEGFADRKVAIGAAAAKRGGLTIGELGLMLDEIPFGDDRKALLVAVAPWTRDPQNWANLRPHLRFADERELAEQLFAGR